MKITDNLLKFEESGTKVYIPKERYSIDLSLTENPLKFSPLVLQAIEENKDNVNHYPDPYHTELKASLSTKYGIPKDRFIFGTGADGLIENIVRILVNPNDVVVMPELSFLNASFATTISGGHTIFSKMTDDFHIDFQDLSQKLSDKTKMVFLCNPNNPTGLTENRENILSLVKSTEALVVVDEANIEFAGESVIRDVLQYKNLMVVRTFSKGYGLAGMRIGYCVGDEKLAYYIWRLRPPFVNTYLAQKAALAALKDEDHIQKSREYVATERQYLSDKLSELGFVVNKSEANCFLVKVTPKFESSTQFCDLLHKHDVTVVDGKYFMGLGDDYVRIAPQLHETNEKFVTIVKNLYNEG